MKNKVLIRLIVPELDQDFDLFIPVNELVWKVKQLIIKVVGDMNSISLTNDLEFVLFNRDNGRIYNNNEIILETDIRNSTELILMSK